MASPPCQVCHDLRGAEQKTDYQDVYRGAVQGCAGCSLLLSAVLHDAAGRRDVDHLQIVPDNHLAGKT